jgi:hypothetical protein
MVRPHRLRRGLVRVAATVAGLFLLSGTALAVSWPSLQRSLPGDPGYPIKLALERGRVALAIGPASDASVYLDLAEIRLEELVRAQALGRADVLPEVLRRYLEAERAFEARLSEARAQGVDVALLEARAGRELRVHIEVLSWLRDLVPEESRRGIDRAIEASRGAGPPPHAGPPGSAGPP